jgi:hypothetical protein
VPPLYDGSPQATANLHPAVQAQVARFNAAKANGAQGHDAAKKSIAELGKINNPDARNVLAWVASNPAATAAFGGNSTQQLRSDAVQQLNVSFRSLGPTEIRALANTLGNSAPPVGGAAQQVLGLVGANGSPEQQETARTELKRVADQGAPAERMGPNDPRAEANADGKSASRATDILVRLGPPPNGWGADDYRRMLRGASGGGVDGKSTSDEIKRGLNNIDPRQREMANRAMRAAIDDGRVLLPERDQAVRLMSEAGRFTADDIPRLEKVAGFGSVHAKDELNAMAKAGVEQLEKRAAGPDGDKGAQAALIALAEKPEDAADALRATGVRLPTNWARPHAERAAENLFNAGGQDPVTRADLARVVVGSEKPGNASVLKALPVLQNDANRANGRALEAVDAAQRNANLSPEVRAAAVKSLGTAAASGKRGAGEAVALLRGIGEEPFQERNGLRYQAAVDGLRDAGLKGEKGAFEGLRETALKAKGSYDPRADAVNKALATASLEGARAPATEAIKTLSEIHHFSTDPKTKSKSLAALGAVGFGLADQKAPDGKPLLSRDDTRVEAVRSSLRAAVATPATAEQGARELRKIAPFLDKTDADLLVGKLDPSQEKTAMQSLFTLSQVLPNLSPAEKKEVFDDLRRDGAIAKLAPKMNEWDVASVKWIAANDAPENVAGYLDPVIRNATDSRAKAAAASGLVQPERFNKLTTEQRSLVVDAIKQGGLSHERLALHQTLGYSPVQHDQLVKVAKQYQAAGNDGGKRDQIQDANQDAFKKQWDYVSSESFKHRLALEATPEDRKKLLNGELSKLGHLDSRKDAQTRADVQKVFGKEGLDALDAGPIKLLEQHVMDPKPRPDGDPILDGGLGLLTEGAVWLKDSWAAKRLVDLGIVAGTAVKLADQATFDLIGPNTTKDAAEVLYAGWNATGRGPAPRPLRPEEIKALKEVFGDGIDYSKVQLKFGNAGRITQDDRPVAMPDSNGKVTIFYPLGGRYKDPPEIESLVHEVTHAWQRQHGSARYAPKSVHDQLSKGTREAYGWERAAANSLPFSEWGPEQQAMFIEDAYRSGAFKDPKSLKYVRDGIDYSKHLKLAVELIRAGKGAP